MGACSKPCSRCVYEEFLNALSLGDLSMLSRVNKACREGVSDLVGESRTRLSVRHHVVSKERLKWARENGCPWGEGVCSAAARGGHLEVLQYARANECPWDEDTCSAAAWKAIWMCCSGPGQTDALGKKARAQPLPVEAIWMCCSGPGQTDVRGMKARAEPLPVEAIWMCCSGPGQTDVRGMKARVASQLMEAIWRCCSGPGQTDALGMKQRVRLPWREVI